MSMIYYKGDIAVTENKRKEDTNYIKELLNYTSNPDLSKKERIRCVTNVYLKIYYESSYLLQNSNFKSVCISKSKKLKSEVENEKSKLSITADSADYLINLFNLFLGKYDN